MTKAISIPPNPAKSMPKFQPEKSTRDHGGDSEAHSPQMPADRLRVRFSKYPWPARV
jgi:hypothetical protein